MVTTAPQSSHSIPAPASVAARPPRWALAVLLALTVATYSYLAGIRESALPSVCSPQMSPLACWSLSPVFGPVLGGNLALHLINSSLAMMIFLEWMPALAALVASAWFALHPLQAEAVSLAAGRAELLAATLALASMLAWRRRHPWPAAVLFALSLGSGPAALGLPLMLAAFEISMGGQVRRGVLALRAMLGASLAALGWMMFQSGGSLLSIVSAGPALIHAAGSLLLPTELTIFPIVDQSAVIRFAAWITIAGLTGAAFTAFGKLRLGFWFLICIGMALPVFLVFRGPEAASDRHLYLPMLAVAAVVGRFMESTRFPALLAAGALLLAGLTFARGSVFRSGAALWEEASQQTPAELKPRIELAKLSPPRRALELLLDARERDQDSPEIAALLADVYLRLNLPGEAINEYGRALRRSPERAEWHVGRGWALAALQLNDAALTDFEVAVALSPCLESARAALNLPPLDNCASDIKTGAPDASIPK